MAPKAPQGMALLALLLLFAAAVTQSSASRHRSLLDDADQDAGGPATLVGAQQALINPFSRLIAKFDAMMAAKKANPIQSLWDELKAKLNGGNLLGSEPASCQQQCRSTGSSYCLTDLTLPCSATVNYNCK